MTWNDTIQYIFPKILELKEEIKTTLTEYNSDDIINFQPCICSLYDKKIFTDRNTYFNISYRVKIYKILNQNLEGFLSHRFVSTLKIEYSVNPIDNYITISSPVHHSDEFVLNYRYYVDSAFEDLQAMPKYFLCSECYCLIDIIDGKTLCSVCSEERREGES
jgi:hypothetical protein